MKRHAWIAIAFIAACGKGSGSGAAADRPKLTQMPPGADGLVIGASTEAQVAAKMPGAQVDKDQSLGGSGVVAYDDHPCEYLRADKATATLWKDAGGTLRLMRWQTHGPGLCDWAAKTTSAMNGDKACIGNRRMDPGETQWCVASSDGAVRVVIDCHVDHHGANSRGDELDVGVYE